MDIFRKDMILKQIASEIKNNRNAISHNVVELHNLKQENSSLGDIYEDYKGYHDYIVNMKKEQELQILRLLHYLEKNMLEANLTDRMVREAKHEQQMLLSKLNTVRSDLAEITEEAENL
jgi:hypothetical protein